ncbi:NADH-dependent flavin oxidoreductase [Lentilactobacillus fungorum]|jgi:2,4-dienoyl-CoA reductase-like NADH-dependent reductase (Old Yellow Enzyme family)|uniref:NADH-dependent flavin oxidoreductase n=1 Tax=Lentilactobacillus fungorum TaxID=2201250 RepID=A0ABQ3VXP8_9LACO|nr:NADH-dependent flavin oxidoreductase [Lentilactobacillus fungorum]GHP13685.1 NADH-dependent flavin oxidoreductase [Lentilactobacillus fungorum]
MTNYHFFKPYTLRNGVTIKNRLAMSPMTEQSSFEDGSITNDEIAYYRLRAGGVGMMITGCANVNDLGKGFEGELSVANRKMLPGLTRLANAMKLNHTKAILQIFSAGRMSNSKVLRGKQPVSASAVAPLRPGAETPRALTNEEVEQTIKDFASATQLAIDAGFDGVELHGANTYLMQQFFSPHSNRRTDKWGGTLEKRMNFPLAVVAVCAEVIKQRKPSFILGYRISPEELETPGIRLADTLALIKKLNDTPIDYLHISLADAFASSIVDRDDHQPIFEKIKPILAPDLPLMVVGHLATPAQVEKLMAAGVDFAAMGRELIREPKWVQKVEAGDEKAIRYTFSLRDLDELKVTPPLLNFLMTAFRKGFPLSTDDEQLKL